MRAVKYEGRKRFSVVEVPDPIPVHGEVLVRVRASAICGSERHRYSAETASPTNGGHEAMGAVEDTNGTTRFQKGDRVSIYPMWGCGKCLACGRGEPTMCLDMRFMPPSHSELIAVPEWLLIPVLDSLDNAASMGLLGCGIGVAYGGALRLGLTGARTVLVTGAGPIGLASTIVHRHLGARVLVVEKQAYRIGQAKELGAHEVISPDDFTPEAIIAEARRLTDGIGPDGCIECSGNGNALKTCLGAVRLGGTVVTIGNSVIDDFSTWRDLTNRYVSIRGSWHFHLRHAHELNELVRLGVDPGKLVTHRLPVDRVQEAYDLFEAGQTGKVVLLWE